MTQILNPLASHIRTIKKRLIIVGATIVVALMVAFAFSGEMVAWLNRPFSNQLVFYGPTEALFASIKVSLLAAILASLPVIFYQCWKCIEPALLPKEQRWGVPLFVLAGVLFACGLTFCNLVILPLVIDFFVSFGMDHDVTPELSVGTYIDFNV
jgi:sec-independent protein translocase protein TatC